MTELEQEHSAKDGGERKTIVHEYEIVVESLLRDLEMCKAEQIRMRLELETLRKENKAAAEIAKESFSHANIEECVDNQDHQESMANLQMRISLMEKEKESVFQLWQMALKAVDSLEEELKTTQTDGRATKYYEEQVNNVKDIYSEAIKGLEAKLLQAKENFVKHQSLWACNKEKLDSLSEAKSELEKKLVSLQSEIWTKEESNRRTIDSLQSELQAAKRELENIRGENSELQETLQEMRIHVAKTAAKDEESKSKILEAIELVEMAVKEKDMALQRETRALEDKANIEARLNNIVEEYTSRLDKELNLARENIDSNSKRYLLEIKELKAELREKVTLLDRVQRENRLVEDELEKVRHGSEDFLQRSSANVLELEQKLKEAHFKIETCEENCRRKYDEKIRKGEERIMDLEDKVATSTDKLRRTQLHSNIEFDERIREADERTKEVLDRYSGLERRLTRALDERENLACELRSLQSTYDREISRRDNERRLQEARFRELQDELQNANNSLEKANARGTLLIKQIESLQQESQIRLNPNVNSNESQALNAELSQRLRTLQEKFDQRTKEISQHVETHQKLCSKWKDEAKFLTAKFQTRSKELREKVNILRKENEELNKELLLCRQQLAHCRVQVLYRYDHGDATR